jgi:hypothetical protein
VRIWVLPLAGTVLVLGYLSLAPTEDMSYRCADPPIVRILDPQIEYPELQKDFFDSGTHCNEGARTRARQMVGVAVLGAIATAMTVVAARHDEGVQAAAQAR